MTITVLLPLALSAPPAAAATVYGNRTDFLAAAGPAVMESFEGLTADNQSRRQSTIAGNGFTLVCPDGSFLSVWDQADAYGQAATDGTHYVEVSQARTVRFELAAPVLAFGLDVIDWGDSGSGTLSYTLDTGGTGVVAQTPLADGNVLFFGILADAPFGSLTLSHTIGSPATTSAEAFALDRVYTAQAVPAPPALLLLGSGLLGLVAVRRRGTGSRAAAQNAPGASGAEAGDAHIVLNPRANPSLRDRTTCLPRR